MVRIPVWTTNWKTLAVHPAVKWVPGFTSGKVKRRKERRWSCLSHAVPSETVVLYMPLPLRSVKTMGSFTLPSLPYDSWGTAEGNAEGCKMANGHVVEVLIIIQLSVQVVRSGYTGNVVV